MAVAELLVRALEERGTASVRDLVRVVRDAGGHGVSRRAVEGTLTGDERFVLLDAGRARWALRAPDPGADRRSGSDTDEGAARPAPATTTAATTTAAPTRARLADLGLRPWQAEALARWSLSCRGVVEAVTGTGKTRLAMAAIRVVVDGGGRALVLVPTLELQDQWVRELRSVAPDLAVGRLGGGSSDDLFARQVLVATPHSAADVPVDLPPGAPGLLVADEAHRYGAPTWGAALSEAFDLRLALTATYERGDDGLEAVLAPYFGEVVHRYGFDRAAADGTIAPFRIALVTTPLTTEEQQRHDRADHRARQLHRELVGGIGMPADPRELFAAVAAVVAGSAGIDPEGPQARACREYLVRVRERREVAATAAGKLEVCRRLAPVLAGRRSLVFTDTVEQAEAAASVLAAGGVRAETVHGALEGDRRRIRLALLRRGDLDALVAPRVLDEGVDVPDADVAVVLAAFRTRRQLVQRLGRVLRSKPDGREAHLVLASSAGTLEDPARGGHRGFLDQVRDVAREVVRFDLAGGASGELAGWLGAAAPGPEA